jgi:hypothetical protein
MRNLITTLILFPTLFLFSSFTNDGIHEAQEAYVPAQMQSYKEFIQDAYTFRLKNHMEVPSEYYEILGIEDPTTPAWVKAPAVEPPKPPTFHDKIPLWVRVGQLMKESSSYYNDDGTIKYVNRTRGGNNHRAGAIGPFQVLRCAWDDMKKEHSEELRGRQYSEMQRDTKLNEEVAAMYLLYIYNKTGNKNWNTTIMKYNCGPWGDIDRDAREYLRLVKKYSCKIDK